MLLVDRQPLLKGAFAAMTTNLAREGFDIDLRHGLAREEALVHTLLGSRVEAKSDGKCRLTGNLFLEFRHCGRPSGIAATTASRWAFEYDDDHWLIVPTDLVRHSARRALREGRRVVGGDFNESEGALVPIEWLVHRQMPDLMQLLEERAALTTAPREER